MSFRSPPLSLSAPFGILHGRSCRIRHIRNIWRCWCLGPTPLRVVSQAPRTQCIHFRWWRAHRKLHKPPPYTRTSLRLFNSNEKSPGTRIDCDRTVCETPRQRGNTCVICTSVLTLCAGACGRMNGIQQRMRD